MDNNNETSLKLKLEKLTLDTDQGILESEEKKWGLPLKDLYKYALCFYKDKEGKALHLSYEDKLKLVAFTQQAAHGALDEKTASPLGVFDVIGRDRRAAWVQLGNISQIQAIVAFIHLLDRLCPLFKTYVEAIQKDVEEKKLQKKKEEDEQEKRQELQKRAELERARQISVKPSEEDQQNRIKDALNAQTYEQFLEYAQQQFPGNVDQQAILIRQLQEQHYQQYIQQLAVQQRLLETAPSEHEPNIITAKQSECVEKKELEKRNEQVEIESDIANNTSPKELCHKSVEAANEITEYHDESLSEDGDGFPHMEEANMWTRGGDEVVAFKAGVAAGGRGRLHVAHGETLTVRVPTHEGGRCLFWEFATDHYDIGFGVYFEWSKSPTNQVTVQTSDSEEEDEGDENDFDDDEVTGDLEAGSGASPGRPSALQQLKAPLSVVVEIFRRDSHLEVYAGSHTYPGEGVYLLKFDNTYSLWRSKTLYYRVYYTR